MHSEEIDIDIDGLTVIYIAFTINVNDKTVCFPENKNIFKRAKCLVYSNKQYPLFYRFSKIRNCKMLKM
jgi:hypothetical protein